MTEMNIRARRIDSEFNAERTILAQLVREFRFANNLSCAAS